MENLTVGKVRLLLNYRMVLTGSNLFITISIVTHIIRPFSYIKMEIRLRLLLMVVEIMKLPFIGLNVLNEELKELLRDSIRINYSS